jgi:hypothetical protein
MKHFFLNKIALKCFLFLTFCAVLFNSCNTKKLDIYEPYKDITIVYCLLNSADSIQYAKINKAFLGDGNAYEFAKNPDSINYNPNDLKVSLIASRLNETTGVYEEEGTIEMRDTVISVDDNSGIFTKKNNIVWYASTKIKSDKAKYKLIIKNKKTGKEATSETKMINVDNVGTYFQLAVTGRFLTSTNPLLYFYDENVKSSSVNISFARDDNSNLYNLIMRMNYIEYPSQQIGDSVEKYVEYIFPEVKRPTQPEVNFKLDANTILSALKSKKTSAFADLTKSRKMRNITFYLYAASPDFTDYAEVNAPKAGYLLDKPIYTNITNGYGLFANRYNTKSKNFRFDYRTIRVFRDSLNSNIILP